MQKLYTRCLLAFSCLLSWLNSQNTYGQSNMVLMVSPPGDYIGQGQTLLTTSEGGFSFASSATHAGVAAFGYWFTMDAPTGETLTNGLYGIAHRWPFQGPDAGIDASGNGRGCNTECGSFRILEMHYAPDGTMDRFWGKYTNQCECFLSPLTVEIRYHSLLADAPIPPALISQPVSQTVLAGSIASMSVSASENLPLTYQWRRNNVILASQTTSTLTLSNVQVSAAGSYTVTVSNSAGSTNTAAAVLQVRNTATCVSAPSGLIALWNGEGNALDSAGVNHGSVGGSAGFTAGKVGLGMNFTGPSASIIVPDTSTFDLGLQDFTIELWVNLATAGGSRAFLAKDEGSGNTSKWIFWLNDGKLQFLQNNRSLGSGTFTPVLNHWHHVAVTRHGALYSFYLDGALNSTDTSTAPLPHVNAPLTLGMAENNFFLAGLEDEVSVYNRALSSAEVQQIYNADYAGKCQTPKAPLIVSQPQSQTVYTGNSVAFSVLAGGSTPFSYQWRWNGIEIDWGANPSATNATLLLTNLSAAQAGTYSVTLSNAIGSASSADAILTVLENGSCLPPPEGLISLWRGEGNGADAIGADPGLLVGDVKFRPGEAGYGFTLTNGAYVIVPDTAAFNFGANDFTIELWVNFAATNSNMAFVAKDEGPGATAKWIFWRYNGQLIFQIGNGQTQTVLGSGSFTPTPNAWYHVAVTREGANFSFYVNGQKTSSVTSNVPVPPINAMLTLGQAEGGFGLIGSEDEISIYSRALTGDELRAIYLAGSSGKCSPSGNLALIVEPQSQSAAPATDVMFTALAAGTGPISYQWNFAGNPIPGATSPVLWVTNAQSVQSGLYSVTAKNALTTITSSNAQLNVTLPGSCVTMPGPLAWWRADGGGLDSAGSHPVSLLGGAAIVPGKAGVAFGLTNGTSYLQAADSPDWPSGTNDFSIELWARFNSTAGNRVLLAQNEGPGYTHKWMFWRNDGHLQFLIGNGQSQATVDGGAFDPAIDQWYHLAVARQRSVFTFYVNGVLATVAQSTFAIPSIDAPLLIGQAESQYFFGGLLDEITIYSRALTPIDVRTIYQADNGAKCGPPSAPQFYSSPADQIAFAGGTATFNVLAIGSPAPTFQWRFDGTDIPGATTPSLTLTNLQLAQAGLYSVAISNSVGSTLSSNALLTVLSSGECLPAPAGLVSSWSGDGSPLDVAGTNNGILVGNAGYAHGKVGPAFDLRAGGSYVQIPGGTNTALGSQDFTIELWAQFPFSAGNRALISRDEGPGSTHKWIFWVNNGQLQFLIGNGSSTTLLGSGAFVPVPNQWHHLAVTRNGNIFSFYVDGLINSVSNSSVTVPPINADVTIGQAENLFPLGGLVDEVALYARALSATEIQLIYQADDSGRCRAATMPVFVQQPQSQATYASADLTFDALVAGSSPLKYQWLLNGVPIPAATVVPWVLTNVQPSMAGTYSLLVTNEAGSETSSNVIVTILTADSCAPPPAGMAAWWRAEGTIDDATGANVATLAGGAAFVPGKVGYALSLTNGTSYAQLANGLALNFANADFSFDLWALFTQTNGTRGLISKDEGPGATHKWILQLNNGQLQFFVGNGGSGQSVTVSTALNPVPNQWYHLAMSRSAGICALYVNGTLAASSAGAVIIPDIAAPVRFGQAENLYYMAGLEDEITFYSRGLSAAEIRTIFLTGANGKCAPPAPPAIISPVADQDAIAGSNVTFSVLSAGGALKYQWNLNGTPLPGATDSALTLTNVQITDAGTYLVTVSNALSVATSSGVLHVFVPGACVAADPSVLSWWPAEGSAADSAGTNDGSLLGGATYAQGEDGVAFRFGTASDYVQIPYSAQMEFGSGDFSIELWAALASGTGNRVFIGKDEGAGTTRKWIFWINNGKLQFQIGNGGTQYALGSGDFNPSPDVWYHLAVTRKGVLFSFYTNGVINSVATNNADIPAFNAPVTIGMVEGLYSLNGSADEISIYGRALSPVEVQARFLAAAAGKCVPTAAPQLVVQPRSITTYAGNSIALTAVASGTAPLIYQWQRNGLPLPDASAGSLTFSNLQAADSGTYSITVSNQFGGTQSTNAVLTVYVPECAPFAELAAGWWGAENTTADLVGTNAGTFVGGADYTSGLAGVAFRLNGLNQYIDVLDAAMLRPTNELSVEAWIYPTKNGNTASPIITKLGNGALATRGYGLELDSANAVHFSVYLVNNAWVSTPKVPVPLNQWSHVVGVFTGSNIMQYVNGVPTAPVTAVSSIFASTSRLQIGHQATSSSGFFGGLIDEPAIYSSALTSNQVMSLYMAATAGKCPLALAPYVFVQPTGTSALTGSSRVLHLNAGGSTPLSYQWRLNGEDIPLASNPTAASPDLILTNLQAGDAGTYSASVTNAFGYTLSSNVVVTVLFPPQVSVSPSLQLAQVGCAVSFQGNATGTMPLLYQWRKNGLLINNATNSLLAFGSLAPADFAAYDLIVTNSYGAVTSSVATLATNHAPVVNNPIVQRFTTGGVRLSVQSLLTQAIDTDGDPLLISSIGPSSIAGGSVTTDGSFVYYLPPPGPAGADAFTFTVSDGHCGGSASGIVLVQLRNDNNPASRSAILLTSEGTIVSFEGLPNQSYRIQTSDSLSPADWQDIQTVTADTYGNYMYVDHSATNAPARYYRSVSP